MQTLQTSRHPDTAPSLHGNAAFQLLHAHFAIANGEQEEARRALQLALDLCKHENDCLQLLNPMLVNELLLWSRLHGIESDINYPDVPPAPTSISAINKEIATQRAPIRIFCLGRFNVHYHDQEITQNTYGRNKPLELLKVLIALGGRQVSQENISELLWPETPGDGAQRNFNTTLHRLRKLLGNGQAVVLKDTLLTLDSRYVQVDLWEAERLLGQLEKQLHHTQPDQVQIKESCHRLFSLFHGDFLGNEPDRHWALLIKERLRNRVLKMLQLVGKYWQTQQQLDLASDIFERGLTLDPLHEVFYQSLMQVHISRGHYSQAAAAYEQCRKVLATRLGVMPSSKTLSLYRQTQASIPDPHHQQQIDA